MAIDGLATPDHFLLWALRQRLAGTDECSRLVSTGFRRALGDGHAETALAAFEAACRVLTDHGVRTLVLLPPSCGFITHDEVRLLSLCCAAQAGHDAGTRRQAGVLVGPVWSPFLFASLERLTCVLARRSLRWRERNPTRAAARCRGKTNRPISQKAFKASPSRHSVVSLFRYFQQVRSNPWQRRMPPVSIVPSR